MWRTSSDESMSLWGVDKNPLKPEKRTGEHNHLFSEYVCMVLK